MVRARMGPRRLVRAVLMRAATYLGLAEDRTDARYRTSYIGSGVRLGQALLEGSNAISDHCMLAGNVRLGYASTLGTGCDIHGDVHIGRFCQFGPYVALYAKDHPLNYLTTYVSNRLFDGQLSRLSTVAPIHIANDVWIGHGTVVLKGVDIGNGAVIGAGSVVVDDIPPYSVALGNPARVMRKRFDDEIIQLLTRFAWWELPTARLKDFKDLFFLDFVAERSRAIAMLQEAVTEVSTQQSSTRSPAGAPAVR